MTDEVVQEYIRQQEGNEPDDGDNANLRADGEIHSRVSAECVS